MYTREKLLLVLSCEASKPAADIWRRLSPDECRVARAQWVARWRGPQPPSDAADGSEWLSWYKKATVRFRDMLCAAHRLGLVIEPLAEQGDSPGGTALAVVEPGTFRFELLDHDEMLRISIKSPSTKSYRAGSSVHVDLSESWAVIEPHDTDLGVE